MYISGLWLLSSNGEMIISKKYRDDLKISPHEVFQEKLLNAASSSVLPSMEVDGVSLYHIRRQQVYMLAATRHQVLPVIIIELLSRLYQLLKDCCGVMEESSVRANVALINEVLDECIDYGYVQLCSAEKLGPYIQSDPATITSPYKIPGPFGLEVGSVESKAADRPVLKRGHRQNLHQNEVFVDVIERLAVLTAANGQILRSEIEGEIKMKAFISPTAKVRLQLNEDLTVGVDPDQQGYGHTARMDDCSFHSSVDTREFDTTRTLSISPPEGEFTVVSYGLRGNLPLGLPLRLNSYVKTSDSSKDLEVSLQLRCEAPSSCHIANLTAHLPIPRSTTNVSQQLSGYGQSADFVPSKQHVVWRVSRISSKMPVSAHFKLIGAVADAPCTKTMLSHTPPIGPLAVEFEVSGSVCSNLKIHQLEISGLQQTPSPHKWIRFLTTSDSYISKLH